MAPSASSAALTQRSRTAREGDATNLLDAAITALNMAESLQRILVRRALSGQHSESAQQLIDWLEQTVVG